MRLGLNVTMNKLKSNFCSRFCSRSVSHSPTNGKPLRVLVTGAAGQIGYSILPRLARGDVWGPEQGIILKMLDLPIAKKVMEGVKMELDDCSFPSLLNVETHTDPNSAFSDCDVIVMLANSMELKENMTRAQLLKENFRVYKDTAAVLKDTCHKDLKVLMVANPANTNCLLLIESLKGQISPSNLTCLTRLDHNRARTMLAQKLNLPNDYVRKVVVWGNHSSTMYPDLRFVEVRTPEGWKPLKAIFNEQDWLKDVFIPTIRERAFAVISARGKSSALSASNAAIDHLRSWLVGTPSDDWVSMGVYSESIYQDIPKGIVFGQPCTCKNGVFTVVAGLEIDDNTREMMKKSAQEILNERDTVFSK